jgi:hypothetical protein
MEFWIRENCCVWMVMLGLLAASALAVLKGYGFSKDRLNRWKVLGYLLMFFGVAWPFLLCGGIKLVGELTYRDLSYDKIKKGMTEDQVRAGWGEPYEVIPSPDCKQIYWHYKSSAVDIDGSRVTFNEAGLVEDFYRLGR